MATTESKMKKNGKENGKWARKERSWRVALEAKGKNQCYPISNAACLDSFGLQLINGYGIARWARRNQRVATGNLLQVYVCRTQSGRLRIL
jgi:hypothetical protein